MDFEYEETQGTPFVEKIARVQMSDREMVNTNKAVVNQYSEEEVLVRSSRFVSQEG